jgi:mannitol/fructose-specific phosphotransferase system IIA component (Ntr-type)
VAKISSSLDDEEVLERLSVTKDPEEIFKALV